MIKVVIIYKYLLQYRIEFFQKLKEELLKYDIELNLIYSKSKIKNNKISRGDEMDIEWAKVVSPRALKIGKVELIWQPFLKHIKNAEMIIVLPELKLTTNYYLMIRKHFRKYKLGFWGHGRNMQGKTNGFRNKINNLFLNKCDWWFAYTNGVKKYLVDHHFPEENITVVQNAIDTMELHEGYYAINDSEIMKIKKDLGITGNDTAIYCGAMYPEKRLDFILQASYRIKDKIPDFNLILIGGGIEADKAKVASEEYSWIHYLGPQFGKDRIIYFKISAVQLMPGAVGLGILDSFALETPIITTEYPFHGPEIDYLENWINGVITINDLDTYSNTVTNILETSKYIELSEGCKISSTVYTMQKMVENFRDGILSCIGQKNKLLESTFNYQS